MQHVMYLGYVDRTHHELGWCVKLHLHHTFMHKQDAHHTLELRAISTLYLTVLYVRQVFRVSLLGDTGFPLSQLLTNGMRAQIIPHHGPECEGRSATYGGW